MGYDAAPRIWNPVANRYDEFSESPEIAEKLGMARYVDYSGCTECGAHESIRYTENNSCSQCLRLAVQAMEELPNRVEAVQRGLPVYGPNRVCEQGPHRLERDVHTGRCANCKVTRRGPPLSAAPRAVARREGKATFGQFCPVCQLDRDHSVVHGKCLTCYNTMGRLRPKLPPNAGPREKARARGERWYATSEPCHGCGAVTKRNVATDKCRECHEVAVPTKQRNANRAAARRAGKRDFVSWCDECQSERRHSVAHGKCLTCYNAMGFERPLDSVRAERDAAEAVMHQCPDLIIDRETARAFGFSVFRTGNYCRRGHNGWRRVSSGECILCWMAK